MQLPTIIIDPSAYEADSPAPSQSVHGRFGRLGRVTLVTGAVCVATFGVAQLLGGDSVSQRNPVADLTDGRVRAARQKSSATLERPVTTPPANASAASIARPAADAVLTPAAQRQPDAPEPATRPSAALPSADLTEDSAQLGQASQATEAALRPTNTNDAQAPGKRLAAAPRRAVARAVFDLDLHVREARRLHGANQLDEAETAYQDVLAHDASESAALIGLARIKLARGQLDAALGFAQRAVTQQPTHSAAHLALADVLRARGDAAGAQAEYALAHSH